ncbi:hypothetical protein SDJN03_15008, partial [Cucurbita argyrosperma subsp. sororia]
MTTSSSLPCTSRSPPLHLTTITISPPNPTRSTANANQFLTDSTPESQSQNSSHITVKTALKLSVSQDSAASKLTQLLLHFPDQLKPLNGIVPIGKRNSNPEMELVGPPTKMPTPH